MKQKTQVTPSRSTVRDTFVRFARDTNVGISEVRDQEVAHVKYVFRTRQKIKIHPRLDYSQIGFFECFDGMQGGANIVA